MMTSTRPRDVGGNFSNRRGHASQLSISDPSHHVTEAIGTMYGDSDDDSGTDSRNDHLSTSPDRRRKERPLSFLASPAGGEQIAKAGQNDVEVPDERQRLVRSTSDMTPLTISVSSPTSPDSANGGFKKSQTMPARISSMRGKSYEGSPTTSSMPASPTLSLRDVQESETSSFPLTNIDNPGDIAKELSNLQALRRMSMDVGNNSDPDLMPFQGLSLVAMPTIAPTGEDDEGDLSRLLWVPAKVHPELAPDQFKNFLENRVKTIKRRSGDSMLSVEGLERNNSGSLRRKKSMLSRQIHSSSTNGPDDYVDGAERLERQKTESGRATPELSLNELVRDPTKAVQKLAKDSQEGDSTEDLPILPVAPGMGLRRSKRTTYRKGGSLRSGDRVPFSKRMATREAEQEAEREADEQGMPPVPSLDGPLGHGLTRVQTEPLPTTAAENFSRPTRSVRRQQPFSRENAAPISPASSMGSPLTPTQSHQEDSSVGAGSSYETDTADSPRSPPHSIPRIVETPPPPEPEESAPPQLSRPYPQRSSSQKAMLHGQHQAQQFEPQQQQQFEQQQYEQQQQQQQQFERQQQQQQQPPPRSSKRPVSPKDAASQPQPQQPPSRTLEHQHHVQNQTLSDMAHHPAPLPGSGATRTDSLTFIPTYAAADVKKSDSSSKKSSREKDDDSSTTSGGGKSTSGWKWFRGEDKEKKKREKEEHAKKARGGGGAGGTGAGRLSGGSEKGHGHDNARLDVLQSSIDGGKGRESLLLDRESSAPDGAGGKLHESSGGSGKKEGGRKSSEGSSGKKEKDGFFGSIFGSKSRKSGSSSGGAGDRDSGGGSGYSGGRGGGGGKHGDKDKGGYGHHRTLSPDPPQRLLRPDIDYHYTRFPIVEERAIYRMAHIKLANPRRPLLSQVLLSNFMYSYLAKVQAMHPQLNVPVSPQQKRLDEERKRREAAEQQYLLEQQQLAQQLLDQEERNERNAAAAEGGGHAGAGSGGQGQGNSFDQYNFEYHRSQQSSNQYGDPNQHQQHDGSADYVDDSQLYEYDHRDQQHGGSGGGPPDQNGGGGRQYYDYDQQQQQQDDDGRRRRGGGDDDMW